MCTKQVREMINFKGFWVTLMMMDIAVNYLTDKIFIALFHLLGLQNFDFNRGLFLGKTKFNLNFRGR